MIIRDDALSYNDRRAAERQTLVMTGTAGRLLVATPPLEDPNFDRTVVLMLEHRDDGALGVVLTRPTPEVAHGPMGRWISRMSSPATIFSGGPVGHDTMISLGRLTSEPDHAPAEDDSWSIIAGELISVDLRADPVLFEPELAGLRVFRGYAGWGPLQLEGELEAGAWVVADADPADAFTADPEGLWRVVLRRQGGRLAWAADAPDDLSAN